MVRGDLLGSGNSLSSGMQRILHSSSSTRLERGGALMLYWVRRRRTKQPINPPLRMFPLPKDRSVWSVGCSWAIAWNCGCFKHLTSSDPVDNLPLDSFTTALALFRIPWGRMNVASNSGVSLDASFFQHGTSRIVGEVWNLAPMRDFANLQVF